MPEGVLGLGSSGSSGLNQELIDKLKNAEKAATVDPLEADLENWDNELETITRIETQVNDFLSTLTGFDLFSTSPNNFEQLSANITGSSVIFDALDVSDLNDGTTNVNVTQLAQRDAYQSDTFTNKDSLIINGQDAGDNLSIQIGTGTAKNFSTEGKTYQELADEINLDSELIASVEEVGSGIFRLAIKSKDSGQDNELTLSQNGIDLGLANASAHVSVAQNMKATIDGIDYDVSSNTLTIQGNLTMTAIETGTSSISIQKDSSQIIPSVEAVVDGYNELINLIDAELSNDNSTISDRSALRDIKESVKNILFKNFGNSDDKNIFNLGFNIDRFGELSLDREVFAQALASDFDGVQNIFIGTAEKPGLGTQLKEHVDNLDSFQGLLTLYGENLASRRLSLIEERDKSQEDLDRKYDLLAQQFAAYTAIITQFENAFGGLQLAIEQSTAR